MTYSVPMAPRPQSLPAALSALQRAAVPRCRFPATSARQISGSFGKLTLNADGSYSYDGDPNVVPPAGATDTFVYTIKDGDGDTSTTTLTINLTDSGLAAATDNDALVFEAALDLNTDGADLAPGIVNGSNPASTDETDTSNTLVGSVTGGTGPYTYTLVSSANGTYGTIQINANGTYIYTLTKPYDTSPDADNANNTEENRDSFTYQATDANGNTVTGTIVVDIVDDIPTAVANTNSVTEGGIVTGNVLTDGTDDVFGADGPTTTVPAGGIVGVAAGSSTAVPVSGNVGVQISGSFGKLTLNADGSYSYDGDPNVVPPAGATDTFVYTIKDGDGDTSTTTLTINLTDSGLAAATDNDALVFEAALDLNTDGADLAPGIVNGSNPASTDETDTSNTLVGSVTGGTGPYTYTLVSSANGTYGTIQINANGTYIYTLTKPYDTSPDADNANNTEENRDSFTYQATDANGNTVTGTIVVDIVDDKPTAAIALNGATSVIIDETAGDDAGSNDILAAGNTPVPGEFTGLGTPIEIARNLTPLVTTTGSSYGADGAGSTVISLDVSGVGASSGLQTTNGRNIFLYKEGNLIVGRASTSPGGTANPSGAIAFAIAIDGTTGVTTVAQYLSIKHDDVGDFDELNDNATNGNDAPPDNSPEPVQQMIANGALLATVTVTDGDGDTATQSVAIGNLIKFEDDGPSYTSASDGVIGNIAGQVEGNIVGSFGADGPGSILLSPLVNIPGVTYSAPRRRRTAANISLQRRRQVRDQ